MISEQCVSCWFCTRTIILCVCVFGAHREECFKAFTECVNAKDITDSQTT